MIELITGLPGNGKTLFTIAQVQAQALKENRPVFYHGIPELTLPWEKLDDPKKWASVPPGSIVVIDEAQKTFRNRSLGTVPPEFVTELETHRHLGIDLVLITQHPSLVDPAVRRLSGRHRHMVRMWGMEASTVHKWDAVKDNCDKSRADSEKSKWFFDKKIYGLYKSAEVHTMKRSIPGRVKLLLLLPFLLLACGWYVYHTISKKIDPVAVVGAPGSPGTPGTSGLPGQPGSIAALAPRFDPVADARNFVSRETPRVVGLLHTAPKYDELTKPTHVPVPSMCIQSHDLCKCFSQQGTPLQVPTGMCMEFARNGFFQDFDPDRDKAAGDRTARGQLALSRNPDASVPSRQSISPGGA